MSKKRTSSIDPSYLTAFETLMDHIEKGWFEIVTNFCSNL
jgi:hypothetical protein